VSEKVCDINELAKTIQARCKMECRTVCLGHIQRGGSPSAFDRNLATKYGVCAVDELLKGECGVVGYKNGKYIYVTIDAALSAKQKFNISDYMLTQELSF
jgi:6-phosphofructokinase 1